MGADIYLESITNVARKKYQPLFNRAVAARNMGATEKAKERAQRRVSKYYDAMYPAGGYFRDSYNPSSLFGALGLSWWTDVGDLLDGNGYLPIDNAKKLLAMVEGASLTLDSVTAYCAEKELADTPHEWLGYWQKNRAELCDMLRKSIALNDPLRCSI